MLNQLINVYGAIREVQMKRSEDMKPQKVVSASDALVPQGCRIPLQGPNQGSAL